MLILTPALIQSCSKNAGTDPGTLPAGGLKIDLSLSENGSLNTTGGYKVVQGVLIINLGTSFSALSTICTHQQCTVGFVPTAQRIECPCHGSQFTVTGSVINGPATSPLRSYTVSRDGNILAITSS